MTTTTTTVRALELARDLAVLASTAKPKDLPELKARGHGVYSHAIQALLQRDSEPEGPDPCFFCDDGEVRPEGDEDVRWAVCSDCGAMGPARKTDAEAVEAWRKARTRL